MPNRRNYLSIVQDGKTRLENNTPVNNFNSQGISKGLIDILGIELEKMYDNIEFIYNSIDPTKAAGLSLDKIGYLVGELRDSAIIASDYSTSNFYFYIDPRLNWTVPTLIKRSYTAEERRILLDKGFISNDVNGDPDTLIIPQGTTIQTFDGATSYTSIGPAIIGASTEAYVGVVATISGPSSNIQTNTLVSHLIQSIPELRKISQYIKCSNRYPIQNGKYSMTDEEFRYKISTARSAIRTNELSIRRTALSVPGVRDVIFEKNKYGNGTVSIIIDGVSPLVSNGLINVVTEKIQQELSYGDIIYVTVPEYLGVELDFAILGEPGAGDINTLRSQARSAVIQYINDLPIGGEIVWNRIISTVLSIEGIQDVIPRVFKYGEYNSFTKVNNRQVALRFSNQKAKYNQKWYSDSGLINCCAL
jgi:hypothetical protein